MATPVVTLGLAPVTPAVKAIPLTTESFQFGGTLDVDVGATATTITVVRQGTNTAGDARGNLVLSALTSTSRLIPLIDQTFADANGFVTVTFSQVTGVVARYTIGV